MNWTAKILGIVSCAMLGGCAAFTSASKKSGETPEKQPPLFAQGAAPADATSAGNVSAEASDNREVAEVVWADYGKKQIAAYFFPGEKLKVGDTVAFRGKDLRLFGVGQVVFIDGRAVGFALLAGTASVGDIATVPGEKLRAEMNKLRPSSPVGAR